MDTPYVTTVEARVHSTQDFARAEFTGRRDDLPVLVVAAEQTAGRGRSGHAWWNAPSAMLASLALSPPHIEHVTLVSLAAGVAAHGAVADELGIVTELKWPNDILLGGAKVGGVLAEISAEALVVGCGINLHWPGAPEGTAGLLDDAPGREAAVTLAHAWASRLLRIMAGLPGSFDRTEYVRLCATVGRQITWQPGGTGHAIGIDADGALLVETAAGLHTLHSEEVTHVRAATIPADHDPDG